MSAEYVFFICTGAICLFIGIIGLALEKQYIEIKKMILSLQDYFLSSRVEQGEVNSSLITSITALFRQIDGFNIRLSHQERNYQGDADMLKILEGGKQ